MCLICEKYGISKTSYEALVRGGVISTTFPAHEEIFVYYKQCLQKTNGRILDAISMVSEDKRVTQRTVYNIIAQFS